MIVPMKKVSLIVMERDSDTLLKKLRETGVVHPHKNRAPSAYLARLFSQQDLNRKAMSILHRYTVKDRKSKSSQSNTASMSSIKNMVNHIMGLADEKEMLQKQLAHYEREKSYICGIESHQITTLR